MAAGSTTRDFLENSVWTAAGAATVTLMYACTPQIQLLFCMCTMFCMCTDSIGVLEVQFYGHAVEIFYQQAPSRVSYFEQLYALTHAVFMMHSTINAAAVAPARSKLELMHLLVMRCFTGHWDVFECLGGGSHFQESVQVHQAPHCPCWLLYQLPLRLVRRVLQHDLHSIPLPAV